MRHVLRTVAAVRFALSTRRDLLLESLACAISCTYSRVRAGFRASDCLLWLILRRVWPRLRDALRSSRGSPSRPNSCPKRQPGPPIMGVQQTIVQPLRRILTPFTRAEVSGGRNLLLITTVIQRDFRICTSRPPSRNATSSISWFIRNTPRPLVLKTLSPASGSGIVVGSKPDPGSRTTMMIP